jgi:hypothetical protein
MLANLNFEFKLSYLIKILSLIKGRIAVPDLVESFVEYALTGFYADHLKSEAGSKRLLMISKAGLQAVLGSKRIGSAQREQLRNSCMRLGIGMAEFSDRFIFFAPEDVQDITYDITNAKGRLQEETEEFARLRPSEADKQWEKMYGNEAA